MRTVLRYAAPLFGLGVITIGFLRARRYRALGRRAQYGLAAVAALPLVASGSLHLVRPSAMTPLLPPWVPGRTLIVVATGVPELAGALGLFFASTRRPAARWLAILMVMIFPANVYVAGERVQGLAMPSVPVRTAMQAGYIVLLLMVGYGWPQWGRARKEFVAEEPIR